jgi:transposase
MTRHRLTDDEWACVAKEFAPPARTGRPRRDARLVIDGILWIKQTGAPWRDLPAEFGPYQSVWHWFNKWNDDGTLDRVLAGLQQSFLAAGAIDSELWCIDGTIVRAARCCNGGGKKVIRASRRTTRWADPAAVLPRKSI